jgi:hypothetical protein
MSYSFGIATSFFVFFQVLFSCHAQKNYLNRGIVLYKLRIFDNKTQEYIIPKYYRDRKLWYYDSLVIAEGHHVNINTDIYGNESWETFVDRYTFIDLKTRTFYEYSTFSDTARILDSYVQPDSGRVKGGWNFFDNTEILNRRTLEYLPDTTIHGISFKRVKSVSIIKIGNEDMESITTGYFRCDKKYSVFSLDKLLSKEAGCPLTRLENEGVSNVAGNYFEIEFLSETLSLFEVKVFKAWKRNALLNTVMDSK